MPSRLDDVSAVDSALKAALELAMDAAAERPLAESMREIAAITRRAVPCEYAALELLADPSRSESPAGEVFVPDSGTPEPPDGSALVRFPIVLRGVPTGELLLATRDRDAGLTPDEQRHCGAIASAAGIVVERVHTAEANQLREQWHEGGVVLAKEIVAERGSNAYQLIVDRVLDLARADTVTLLQLGKTEDSYVIVAGTGPDFPLYVGREIVVLDPITTRVMATGKPMAIAKLSATSLPTEISAELRAKLHDDSLAVIPLVGSGAQHGVIVVTRAVGRPTMSQAEMGMATAFAGTVALALELAESLAQRDELVLVEERDRIARDLHDHVIQRLYAIGLSMQSVANSASGPVGERLISSVDEIDETIKQIRTTIFRLTTPLISSRRSLRARGEALLDDLTPALGFRPRLVSNGPVDFGVDEDIVDDCDAVLRETVTNIARHAHATEAEIAISVSASQLRLEIRDNGRGLGETSRRSGLANLRARAESHDGFMQVRSSPEDGTWVLWSIPLVALEQT